MFVISNVPLFDMARPKKNNKTVLLTIRISNVQRVVPRRNAERNEIAMDVPIRNTNLNNENYNTFIWQRQRFCSLRQFYTIQILTEPT